MKLRHRKYRTSIRARIQHRWPRAHMRRAHAGVRRFISTLDGNKVSKDMVTFTLVLNMTGQQRRYERFVNKTMKRASYRRRVDRMLAEARRTNGRIVHDSRGSRVVPRVVPSS